MTKASLLRSLFTLMNDTHGRIAEVEMFGD